MERPGAGPGARLGWWWGVAEVTSGQRLAILSQQRGDDTRSGGPTQVGQGRDEERDPRREMLGARSKVCGRSEGRGSVELESQFPSESESFH